jgi:hypothetical protein
MIGEIVPSNYDISGKPVSGITRKQDRLFNRTYPMGRYISKSLSNQCSSIKEIRKFLQGCKYVSDEKQFNKKEYWMPPDEFEKVKKGDCDEFALWTWRQFIGLGYKARFVIGRAGRFGEGHAWVTIEKDGKNFIVEPQAWTYGEKLPRLSVIYYEPKGSVEWDGNQLHFFVHKKPDSSIPMPTFLLLLGEWLFFWAKYYFGILDVENFIKDKTGVR